MSTSRIRWRGWAIRSHLRPGFRHARGVAVEAPGHGGFHEEALGSFSRLIRFDKRGTGMSDPVSGAPSLETRMDDVRAVMDAVGSRRAAFYGLSEGAAMSILFAATYPERTAALVVRSCSPRTMWAPDFPWGRRDEAYGREVNQALRYSACAPRPGRRCARWACIGGQEVEAYIDMVRWAVESGDARRAVPDERGDRHPRRCPLVRVPTFVLHGERGSDRPGGSRRLRRRARPVGALRRSAGRRPPVAGARGRQHRRSDRAVPR